MHGLRVADVQACYEEWSSRGTLFMLVKYRPKWGIDFSMDYVDGEGNAMELLHYEFDSFDLEEIQQVKLKLEPIFAGMDWDWKCAFFGLSPERFKMVAWE